MTPSSSPKSPDSRHGLQHPALFIGFTAAAAVTAAAAAHTSSLLSLPVWAMFVGWVAYFTRGRSLREGASSLACVMIGLIVGIGAAISIGWLRPTLGDAALPLVVFAVTLVVVSLRAVPVINHLPGYFLGLIAYFASALEPGLEALLSLGSAAGLGGSAAWLSQQLQGRMLRRS